MADELFANKQDDQVLVERLERAETLVAIMRGIFQFERGEGIPLDEAESRLRTKHGFSHDAVV